MANGKYKEAREIIQVYIFSALLFLVIMFLFGCETTSSQSVTESKKNKTTIHSLRVSVNGTSFSGTGVSDLSDKYLVTVYADDAIDRIQWNTCHQSHVVDRPKLGWGNKYSFTLNRVFGLESSKACPLYISTITQSTLRVAFALIEFKDERAEIRLPATIKCNGETIQANSVGVCQSSTGLIQEIQFDTFVIQKGASDNCDTFRKTPDKRFSFNLMDGVCTYYFGSKDGDFFRLTTIGFTEVPPR